MNTLLKVLAFVAAVFFVAPAVHAVPYTASFTSPTAVSLLENMSVSLPLEIQNNDFRSHTVTLSGFSDEATVKIIPNLKTLTIAPYEKVTVGITVRATDDADHETVPAKVRVNIDGDTRDVPLTVYVGSNPFLTLTTFNSTVCANEYVESISVLVENRTSADTEVTLRAEQSILLPFTEDETLTLENGIEEYVTFRVNVSPPNAGKYTGTIFADTNQITMIRPFVVQVNDCPETVEKTISLKLPTKTYDLTKLKTTNIPISVKNLTDDAQFVEFFVDTDMGYTLNSITIAPRDTANINLSLTPDTSIPAGKKAITITAISGGYRIAQSLNVNVLPLDLLELENVSNIFTLFEGDSSSMDFIVHNRGDSTQSISFGLQSSVSDISSVFSPANVTLSPGKSARIQLTLTADHSVSVTRVNTAISASGSKSSATLPLSYVVEPNPSALEGALKFVSIPKEISLNADEQKEITVTLRNESDTAIVGVRFRLLGVNGSNISVVGPASATLAPYETQTFTLRIVTQEDTPAGVYSPILIAQGDNGSGRAPMSIRVNDGFVNGLLTGLVTFANERAGILGFIVLVILAGYYIFSRSEKRSPVWTAK